MLWSHIVTEMTIIHPTDSLLTLLISKAFSCRGCSDECTPSGGLPTLQGSEHTHEMH